MNQILSMNQDNPSFGNDYNNYNQGGGNPKSPMEINKVKKIFGVALIVFGIVLFIGGIIGLMMSLGGAGGSDYPQVLTEQVENKLSLTINNDVIIDKVEYSWNNGQVAELAGNDSMQLVTEITVPVGNNVLSMVITDIEGKVTDYAQTFVGVFVEDTTPPSIELIVSGSQLTMIGKTESETLLSYLSYQWNDEQPVIVDATGDRLEIETKIDILTGENRLSVTVVNESGIEQTEQKDFVGLVKPVIEAKKSEDGEYVVVTMSHESTITAATIMFNDKPRVLTPDRFGLETIELKLKLEDGTNRLIMEVESADGAKAPFDAIIEN